MSQKILGNKPKSLRKAIFIQKKYLRKIAEKNSG